MRQILFDKTRVKKQVQEESVKYLISNGFRIGGWVLLVFLLLECKLSLAQNDYLFSSTKQIKDLDDSIGDRITYFKWRIMQYHMPNCQDTVYSINFRKGKITPDLLEKIKGWYYKLDSVSQIRWKIELALEEKEFNKRLDSILAKPINDKDISSRLSLITLREEWFYLIEKNKGKILPYILNDYATDWIKKYLLVRINPSKKIADSILKMNDKNIGLQEQARLGNRQAEDSLINKFNESVFSPSNDDSYLTWAKQLLFVGTEKCLRAYISAWSTKKVITEIYYVQQCNSISGEITSRKGYYKYALLPRLLGYYTQYNPLEYIGCRQKRSNHTDPLRLRMDGEKTFEIECEYIREIEKYAFEKYGIKIIIDLPLLEYDLTRAYPK